MTKFICVFLGITLPILGTSVMNYSGRYPGRHRRWLGLLIVAAGLAAIFGAALE